MKISTAIKWILHPTRCDECRGIYPTLAFTVYGYANTYWCRKCANKILGEDYEISRLNTLRYSLQNFREAIEGRL